MPETPGLIGTPAACQLLMLSRQRLDQLAADGWIARHAPGRWRTVDLVQGYIRFMRDEGRRTSKHAADSRVRDARAHEIEIRVAERVGKLVSIEEFDTMIDEILGAFRAELSGLPARFTRDLVQRRSLDREINGLLNRVADVADANAARVAPSRPARAPVSGDGTGSLGGSESDISAVRADTGAA